LRNSTFTLRPAKSRSIRHVQQWQHIFMTRTVTDVPRISGFAKLHAFSAILTWLFVF